MRISPASGHGSGTSYLGSDGAIRRKDRRTNSMFSLKNPRLQSGSIKRAEHVAWCKQRALEYCDAGDLTSAFNSMASDLGKHPETANHIGIQLGMMEMLSGRLRTIAEMRKFIEGFH